MTEEGHPDYYYRGTTRGWPGNPVLQALEITCVTTDPLVATLFALECRNHGQAAVLVAARGQYLVAEENYFALEESAVNLRVLPLEFERTADVVLDVDTALSILSSLGFSPLPIQVPRSQLDHAIRISFAMGQRLTIRQIREFNHLMLESSS